MYCTYLVHMVHASWRDVAPIASKLLTVQTQLSATVRWNGALQQLGPIRPRARKVIPSSAHSTYVPQWGQWTLT